MSRIVVEMTGDEAKLHQAMMAAVADHAKLEQGVDKVAAKSKKLAREEAAVAREAKRIYEETRTPQEQYNARMARLNELVKRGGIDQNTFARASRKAGDELRRTGQKGQTAFGQKALGMVRSFAGALGISAGLAGAVQIVRKEYEALLAVQDKARESSLNLAGAQNAALRNLGADTAAERDAFIADVERVSKEAGVSQKFVYNLASSALSARGELSVADAMDAVKQAALYAPDSAEAGEALAGAALDIGKATGATPQQALGFAMEVGKMARPTATGKIVENVAPAIGGAMQSGASPQSAAALWAALTGGMVDPQGRKAKTATLQVSAQLAEFLPEEDRYTIENGEKKLARKGTGLKTMEDRIAFLQRNADARLEFLTKANFEQIARPSVEQVLSGMGATAQAYKQFYGRLPRLEESGPIFERRLAVQKDTPLQKTRALEQELEAEREGRRTTPAMQLPAHMAIIRKELTELFPDLGVSANKSAMDEVQASGAGMRDPGSRRYWEIKRLQLGRRVEKLENPPDDEFGWGWFFRDPDNLPRRDPTPLEQERAGSGRQMLAKLDQLIQAIEKNSKSTDSNTDETRQAKPKSSPTLAPPNQNN